MATRVAGRYQLVREVGAGKMGRVFQAIDTETGRSVAAKILIDNGDIGLQGLLRFQQEGALLSTLKHPNIVEVYSTHLEEHLSCIIMELLEGRSLRRLLRDEALTLRRIQHLMQQVASALAFAHQRGIVHRDIKPDNIMVVGNDKVKVTDFGIARIMQDAGVSGTLTGTGMSIGTPLYMSPEQIEGGKVDGRTDIYAFGCVLYEMVTGAPPFPGEDPLTIAFKHVHKAPVPPALTNPDLPDAWEQLILRCLAKHADNRYQSAAALLEAVAVLPVADRALQRGLAEPKQLPIGVAARTQLEQESETLLQQAQAKELAGDLKPALHDYRAALTLAPAGPVRTEIEVAITRITARMVGAPSPQQAAAPLQPPPTTQHPPPSAESPSPRLEPAPPRSAQSTGAPPTRIAPAPPASTRTEPTRPSDAGQTDRPQKRAATPRPATPPPSQQGGAMPDPATSALPQAAERSAPIQEPPAADRSAPQPPPPEIENTPLTVPSPRRRRVDPRLGMLGAGVLALAITGGVFAATHRTQSVTPTAVPTAVPTATPAAVSLVGPAASSGASFTSGQRIELRWKAVPGISSYELEIAAASAKKSSDASLFKKPMYKVRTNAVAFTLPLQGYRQYAWRVRARVHGHWGPYSHSRRFVVAQPRIASPVALLPHNGTVSTSKSAHLCWSGVKGAHDYLLRLAGHHTQNVRSTCAWVSVKPGTYHWSVAARMRGVRLYAGSFSRPAYFTIKNKPKPTPVPTAPPSTTNSSGSGSTTYGTGTGSSASTSSTTYGTGTSSTSTTYGTGSTSTTYGTGSGSGSTTYGTGSGTGSGSTTYGTGTGSASSTTSTSSTSSSTNSSTSPPPSSSSSSSSATGSCDPSIQSC